MRYTLQHVIRAVNSDATSDVDRLNTQMKELHSDKPDVDRANEHNRAREMDRVQHELEIARARLVGIQLLSDEIASQVLGEPVPERSEEHRIRPELADNRVYKAQGAEDAPRTRY